MSLKRYHELTPQQQAELQGAFMDWMGIDSLGITGHLMPSIVLKNLLTFASTYEFQTAT